MSTPIPDRLLTPTEAAAESGYSVETIRLAYRSGALRAYQPVRNGRVRIPRSALREWLTSRSPVVAQ